MERTRPSRKSVGAAIASDEMALTFPLSQGIVVLIDLGDFERLAQFKWSAGWINSGWYGLRWTKERMIYLHRFIVGAKKGEIVDHIDGNTLDCRKVNMRIVDHVGNARNRGPNGGRRFKGIAKTGKVWTAKIGVNHKTIRIGSFPTEEAAARAYDAAARQHHGEFARLNFPEAAI